MDVGYPFTTTVPVRYRDLDPMGHVNNAVYATYLEEARVAYFRSVLGVELDVVDTVVASLSIEYERPITLGDELTVEVSVPTVGTTSVPTAYELRVDEQVVATGTVVQVLYDREAAAPKPIPDEWRSRLGAFEDHERE